MCNRRNKPIIQGAVVLALVGGLGYTFYLYNLTLMDLEISSSEANKCLKQQESLSSQLQVVYEHRARLERSLQKEKTDHKNTKLEFSKNQNDFLLNITRSKHEAMNRFNSLDTQYNMLKAQSKELDTDYSRLQQQYSRLSSEQTELAKQQKRNFQLYKEQKTNEIASLDEEIRALKQQVVSLRTHLKSKSEEAEQYKSSSSRAVAASQKYQETLKTLQEQLATYKEKLKNVAVQPRHTGAVREITDKAVKPEARHQDGNVLDVSQKGAPDKQEQVGRHQERLSVTEPPRSDSIHRLESSRRQVPTQIKSPSDNDAEQEDMRRSPDENADQQKQDINDESEKQDRARLRRSDDDKARDDSQSDGYSRYGNVALRDNNQDTRVADKEADPRVVAPVENNAMNKWSDILKAAQQNPHNEGERRQEAEKLTNEDLERESQDERRAADEDRTQRGEEDEAADEQIGKPVVEAGRVGDRVDSQGHQRSNEGGLQGDIGYRNKGNQENWFDKKEEKEGEKELEADGLSREKMNKKIAELEENYQEKQLEAQKQLQGAQPQEVQPQEVQPQERDARVRVAYDHKVAPIPAVQRQDTAQEHQARADADNDDEDAGNAENEQEDPDEQDPDDAGEEDGDNFPAQDSPQQQRQAHQEQLPQHDDRKYDRSLKGVAVNNEQKRQEREQP